MIFKRALTRKPKQNLINKCLAVQLISPYLYTASLASGFHSGGYINCVAPDVIVWLAGAYDSSCDGSVVDAWWANKRVWTV